LSDNRTFLTRTTDGGLTWEPARNIYATGDVNATFGHQILVLPNGTVVCLFQESFFDPVAQAWIVTGLGLIRSTDHGQTWSGRVGLADQFLLPTTDPENGAAISAGLPAFASDRRNGNLYAVWEDARFSNNQYNSIAFSMSADGGLSWSAPIPVNQTPRRVAPGNRQAFLPSIAVAADGTIGISYYDFRFNDSRPGLLQHFASIIYYSGIDWRVTAYSWVLVLEGVKSR